MSTSHSSGIASGDAIAVGRNAAKLSDRSRLALCPCGTAPKHYQIDHAEITDPKQRTF